MKIGWINWNNKQSDTFGVFVTGSGTYNAAEPDVTAYQIPGRNGDLIIWNGRYKNIEVVYPAFIPGDFEARVQAIRNWLRSSTGYQKLTDSYDTSHFRMARPTGVMKFSPVQQNTAANCQLVFDCKPQRFLTGSDDYSQLTMHSGDTITNTTQNDAFPLIYLAHYFMSGKYITFTASDGTAYTITANADMSSESVFIDCETRNVFYVNNGNVNINSMATVSGDGWPVFKTGETYTLTTNINAISIAPRWWEL